ncbi:MAG: biotin synthase BioB [Pelosinus sp.]|nr:biotin synthase BioB [Pelosinus sp.]
MSVIPQIIEIGNKVLDGGAITRAEAVALVAAPEDEVLFLMAMANKIRQRFMGKEVELCSIVNGRSGHCSENCVFCAQSAHHKTDAPVYGLKNKQEILAAAKAAEASGVHCFSIVTSGRGMNADHDFAEILAAIREIKAKTKLHVSASLGTLSKENALALKAAGLERYHHNIETSASFYAKICTTHTYEDRVQTIAAARAAGLKICSGGIFGLGESMDDRIDMAFALRELGASSVPLNILNPVPGTPLEKQPPVAPWEILKTFALFRFILPQAVLRTAGGREAKLRDLQALALVSGLNGMLIGGYLTTGGRKAEDDRTMIRDLGFVPRMQQ